MHQCKSDSGSKYFILTCNGSQGAFAKSVEVCVPLDVNASPNHHWPTTKHVIQSDVTATFSRRFHICHMCSGFHLWKTQGTSGANSGILWQISIRLHGAEQWPGSTKGRRAIRPPSWSLFMIVWTETFPPVTCWRSFCSSNNAQPVPPSQKSRYKSFLRGNDLLLHCPALLE